MVDYVADRLPLEYQTLNDVIGAVSGAMEEFRRRVVVPFENSKKQDNGDVYQELAADIINDWYGGNKANDVRCDQLANIRRDLEGQ